MSICDCSILFAFYNFGRVRYNWIGVCAVKLNLCSCMPSCHQNGKHCNFTLLFCRGWQGLVHKCVPHVQHAQVTFLTRPIKLFICDVVVAVPVVDALSSLKPGFHIVVSVVSVVRKKFARQIQLCGNLPYNRSIRQKRQIQLVVRDRMNSICPMKFFRTTDTTDATDTTIWKSGLYLLQQIQHEVGVIRQQFVNGNPHDKCNKNVSQNTPLLFSKWRRRSKVMLNARSPLSWRNVSAMNPFTTNSQKITRTNNLKIPEEIFSVFMFQLLH